MDAGHLDGYDIVLMDNPEAGLHPSAKIVLAYIIQKLASCGKHIIIATHDVYFIDMLARPERISELLGYDAAISTSDVVLYLLKNGKVAGKYSPLIAYVETYAETIAGVYGIKLEKVA